MTVEEFSCRKSASHWLNRWKHKYKNCTITKSKSSPIYSKAK